MIIVPSAAITWAQATDYVRSCVLHTHRSNAFNFNHFRFHRTESKEKWDDGWAGRCWLLLRAHRISDGRNQWPQRRVKEKKSRSTHSKISNKSTMDGQVDACANGEVASVIAIGISFSMYRDRYSLFTISLWSLMRPFLAPPPPSHQCHYRMLMTHRFSVWSTFVSYIVYAIAPTTGVPPSEIHTTIYGC